MGCIQLNLTNFRAIFSPAFDNTATYSDTQVENAWDLATGYITNKTGGCYCGGLSIKQQTQALNLMTAHLLYLFNIINAGEQPGFVTGASIDKISVQVQPPPATNEWQWWLNQSPYGAQLLALLQVIGVGGFYFTSGLPGRAGFRGGIR